MKKRTGINSFIQNNHWFLQINESRMNYVKRYNSLSKKEGAVNASATLFQIKEGIEKLIATNQDSIKEKLSVIIEFLEKETKNEKALPDLAKMILARAKTFHEPDIFKSHMRGTAEFRQFLKSYYNKYNGTYWHISDEYFKSIESLKSEVNQYAVNIEALNSMLKQSVNESFPESLKNLSKEELEKEVTEKQGRPFDETAPQDKIKKFIKKAIKKAKGKNAEYKRFWHFEGQHKGKPNKKQLREALIKNKLSGELSEETVKERVNKALDELGY
ncbi:MAG: hypothetical protein WDZ80_03300 [Candidatus Paceibacterota bacterium]